VTSTSLLDANRTYQNKAVTLHWLVNSFSEVISIDNQSVKNKIRLKLKWLEVEWYKFWN